MGEGAGVLIGKKFCGGRPESLFSRGSGCYYQLSKER
jgi:hypothetical protein